MVYESYHNKCYPESAGEITWGRECRNSATNTYSTWESTNETPGDKSSRSCPFTLGPQSSAPSWHAASTCRSTWARYAGNAPSEDPAWSKNQTESKVGRMHSKRMNTYIRYEAYSYFNFSGLNCFILCIKGCSPPKLRFIVAIFFNLYSDLSYLISVPKVFLDSPYDCNLMNIMIVLQDISQKDFKL